MRAPREREHDRVLPEIGEAPPARSPPPFAVPRVPPAVENIPRRVSERDDGKRPDDDAEIGADRRPTAACAEPRRRPGRSAGDGGRPDRDVRSLGAGDERARRPRGDAIFPGGVSGAPIPAETEASEPGVSSERDPRLARERRRSGLGVIGIGLEPADGREAGRIHEKRVGPVRVRHRRGPGGRRPRGEGRPLEAAVGGSRMREGKESGRGEYERPGELARTAAGAPAARGRPRIPSVPRTPGAGIRASVIHRPHRSV